MTHHEAMNAPLHRASCCDFHKEQLPNGCAQGRDCPERGYAPREQAREQADTPVYSPDDMHRYVFWAIVALCVLALLAALSPAFWSAM